MLAVAGRRGLVFTGGLVNDVSRREGVDSTNAMMEGRLQIDWRDANHTMHDKCLSEGG